MKKKTFFKWADGDVRWTPMLVLMLALTIVAVAILGRHIYYGLVHKFADRGIWTVLGLLASFFIAKYIDRTYSNTLDSYPLRYWFFALLCIYFGAILGPYVGLKQDRLYSIPDEQVYYANGKVTNAWHSDKKNFYFNTYTVSPEDSLYIVEYGEEPGYNWEWRSVIQDGKHPKSVAPRADVEWKKPLTNETLKIKTP